MGSRDHERSGASSPGLMAGLMAGVIARLLLAQLGLTVVLAALFWGTGGVTSGYSALLGGLTCVIPNAFLAMRLSVPRRDPGPGALVRAAYIGELGKLALTVLMFTVAFTLVRPLEAWPLIASFVAAQLMTLGGFLMRDNHGFKHGNNKGPKHRTLDNE